MEISRKDQIEFAKEMVAIVDNESIDAITIGHLKNMTSLLISWVGSDNGVAVNLGEYVGELASIKGGDGDPAWKEEFKRKLDQDIEFSGTDNGTS